MKSMAALFVMLWTVPLSAQDWPRQIVTPQGAATIYEPQIESFRGDTVNARAAISILPVDNAEPVFGAVWLHCRVSTDRTSRTVKLEDVKVRRIKFPKGMGTGASEISAALEDQMPFLDLTFSLDLLLESLETAQKERESARELDVTPPKIIVMNVPAVLVLIDGDPVLTDVEGTSLKRVINTPYFLVQEPSSGQFYLRGGAIWYRASNVAGPWRPMENPPKAAVDLSDQLISEDESEADSTASDVSSKTGKIPEIVVSTVPAELIATDGPAQFSPVDGTGLLYVSNTSSRLFREIATQQYYVLLSGRWYRAKTLTGPWTYVASRRLPADFAKIPPGSPCDDVLSSVAGTTPAREAMLDAQIPQTAEVDRATATTDVQYDGDPEFEPIENTSMEYAVNTQTAVIRVGGRYYDCDNGVWFEGPGAFGPWAVCISVPEAIYTIPPRYPVYNVRYVRVYSHTPSVVYVGYTAGYTGCFVYGGTVVYGTGYHYRPWYRRHYYARPWTWGFGVHYYPWTGWSFGASVGWGKQQGWFADNSRTVYAGWWGPVGYRPAYRSAARPAYRKGSRPAYHQVNASAPVRLPTAGVSRSSGARRTGTLYDRWTTGVKRPVVGGTRTPVAPISRPAARPTTRTPIPPAATTSRPATRPTTRLPSQPATPRSRPAERPTTRPPSQPAAPPSRPAERPTARPPSQPAAPPSRPAERPTTRPPSQPAATPAARPPRTEAGGTVQTPPSPPSGQNNVYAAPDGSVLRRTPQGWEQRDQNTWKPAAQAPAKAAVERDDQVRQRAAERSSSFSTPPPPQPPPKAQPTRDSGTQRKKEEKKR
jgi:hypothetical protein